ncbi:MAG: aminotransferase class I/II-fold pyridoxal phosphate-dependent enzyme [Propionibacteriales bacterium]|nr:aminotransferase class I/II-fold pyridoxal phosphate-dependent enzyme [Propionibacteriales bacterium]
MVVHSATLQINEAMQARRGRGEPVVHLGFGEAGLPVLPEVAEVLRQSADLNSYGPVTGDPHVRASAAGYLTRRGIATEAPQVLFAPGSKALLFALMTTLPGDVVLPTPSWVTYAAQAAMTGKEVVPVPIPAGCGGVPDPELLGPALTAARADGVAPGIVLLTLPDNPTGTTADAQTVKRVCEIAQEQGLVVVSDEIYRDLAEQPQAVTSPAALLDDHVVITGGLSKSLALGGWRIGFARTPATPWGDELMHQLVGVASEVWSCLATPMQAAARFVLDDPDVVTERVAASRRLHLAVSRAMYEVFVESGATCRPPSAAFYQYPDLEPLRDGFARHGAHTAAAAAALLLDRHGIGVLPGDAFGDEPEALRFRVATSLLYGEGQQRLDALTSDHPAHLPWIAPALDTVRHALRELA